jgi:hypothetical protein
MDPVLVTRSRGARAVQAMMLCAASWHAAAAWPASNPVELGEIRKGTYEVRGQDIRVKVPPGLGNDVWKREFVDITGQLEVHFGDGQCRRYYLKQVGGSVGAVVAADAAARGSETVLRAVAGQFAGRRGETVERSEWLQTRQGTGWLMLTADARGRPCVQASTAGGQTLGAAWFLLRGKKLFEIGYQVGIGPSESVEAAMAAARSEAAAFLDRIELPREGKVVPVFPWRAGDPAPALAGISLGDALDVVEARVGRLEKHDEGEWRLEDEERRLSINVTAARGAVFVIVGRRAAGDVGGVRVGDRFEDVVRKWGPPPESSGIVPGTVMYMYYAGEWRVQLTVTKGRLNSLAIGFCETPQEPRPAAGAAVREPIRTDTLPPEQQMVVGQRFLLPAGTLANHSGGSVAHQAPGRESVEATIAGIVTSLPSVPGSGPARERLAELLRSGPVLLEITSVVDADWGRMVAVRLSVNGEDLATTMVREGWAIAVKSRAADPRLLAAEAEARANRRGLWGLSTKEFFGHSPDDYFAVHVSLSLEPEVYLPGE